MEFIFLSFPLAIAIICNTAYHIAKLKKYNNGYNDGWDDCVRTYRQFEMSYEDELVLEIMKKSFRSYMRNKKYVDKEDLNEINSIDNFHDFKHAVHEIAIYRKENLERE